MRKDLPHEKLKRLIHEVAEFVYRSTKEEDVGFALLLVNRENEVAFASSLGPDGMVELLKQFLKNHEPPPSTHS